MNLKVSSRAYVTRYLKLQKLKNLQRENIYFEKRKLKAVKEIYPSYQTYIFNEMPRNISICLRILILCLCFFKLTKIQIYFRVLNLKLSSIMYLSRFLKLQKLKNLLRETIY